MVARGKKLPGEGKLQEALTCFLQALDSCTGDAAALQMVLNLCKQLARQREPLPSLWRSPVLRCSQLHHHAARHAVPARRRLPAVTRTSLMVTKQTQCLLLPEDAAGARGQGACWGREFAVERLVCLII